MKNITILLFAVFAFYHSINAQVYINENFNAGIPGSWTVVDSGSVGNTWIGTTLLFNGTSCTIGGTSSLDGTEFVIANSCLPCFPDTLLEILESPVFDASGATTVILEFDHFYREYDQDTGFVEVFNGTTWIPVDTFPGDLNIGTEINFGAWGAPDHPVIDITAYINSAMQVRFRYEDKGDCDWYWAVDNVKVYAPVPDDVGVIAIDAPITGCGLSVNDSIIIRVQNFGDSAQTNIPVSYRINGGTIVNENITSTLNPGDTVTYTFTTTSTVFSTPGTHTIDAWTSLGGDGITTNDSLLNYTFVHIQTISAYPYLEDFESGQNDWSSGGANSSWAFGLPQKTTIDTAASGTNCWVTGGLSTGTYLTAEDSYVLSPCFDFTSLVVPVIRLKIWWDSELNYDGAVLQSTIDDGVTWQNVGAFGDPLNWYNNGTMFDKFLTLHGSDAWAGLGVSGSSGWVTAKHEMPGLGGQSNVRFRIAFASDVVSLEYDGFSFDDVEIFEAFQNDAGVIAIDAPLKHGCAATINDNISIRVVNFGVASQSNIPVSYRIDGGAAVNNTISATILPGDTLSYTFTTTADLSAIGIHNIDSWTNMAGDEDTTNDAFSAWTFSSETISKISYFNGLENDSLSIANHFIIENTKSNVFADSIAAKDGNFGLILDGKTGVGWIDPVGGNEWGINPDFFSAIYFCVKPDPSVDTLLLRFNLKQIYHSSDIDTLWTNFRLTIDGNQITSTYNPAGATTGWDTITIDLDPYLGGGAFIIGFESSCILAHDQLAQDIGTGNYIDNILLLTQPSGFLPDSAFYCIGDSVLLDAGNAASIYSWSNGKTSQMIYVDSAGTYTVVITNDLGSITDSVIVNSINLPVANFSSFVDTLTVTFTDLSTYADTYLWDFGDANTDSTTSPVHTYASAGTYNVCLMVSNSTNNCASSTYCDSVTVSGPVGIDEEGVFAGYLGSVQIFPNPNTGKYTISFKGFRRENIELTIVDIQGKIVYNNKFPVSNDAKKQIDVSQLVKGVYIVKIQTDHQMINRKLFIE